MGKIKNIRIRMYRQGLGDCFLVTLRNDEDKMHHILIDCGVIMGTQNPGRIMTKVANNIKSEVGEKIDTVVITHEHWDHVSGFIQAQKVFDKLKFGEVWLGWTEDPNNELANKLRMERENRKRGLTLALQRMKGMLKLDRSFKEKQKRARLKYINAISEINSFNGIVRQNGISSTSNALKYVINKGKNNISYLLPGSQPFSLDEMEGLRFYILAPPQDEKLIKKDFSKKEVYHSSYNLGFGNNYLSALLPDLQKSYNDNFLPFEKSIGSTIWVLFNDEEYKNYFSEENDWRRIDHDWLDFSGQLALALDSDTNNTSLVIAMEIIDKEQFLLFPGDAQVGNWLSWYNYKWKVKNRSGKKEEIDIEKIFDRTVLYKVAHHGSHNATLKDKGLEMMKNNELVALIPINKKIAHRKHWNMPFPTLFDRLKEKTSGKILEADEDFNKSLKPSNLLIREWEKYKNAVTPDENKLYIDYSIDC